MVAKYIIGVLAVVFLIAATVRRGTIQGRTWLLIGTIFSIVSGWLFISGG